MAETENSGEQNIPPKLVIRPPAPAGGDASEPPTVAPSGSSKKETSRVPLNVAEPPAGAAKPQTIRLKPLDTGTVRVAKPGIVTQAPTVRAVPVGAPVSEKRKTSRISLEDALSPSASGADSAPKTIRLKKPSEVATVRVGQADAVAPAKKGDTADIKATDASHQTADLTSEADDAQMTRRRTIRVKRPARGVTVKGAAADVPADSGVPEAAPAVVRDEPNWFFIFSSVAATLVACVLIYVLVAQALGPNMSLTQLSWGVPEVDLPWPGKIIGNR